MKTQNREIKPINMAAYGCGDLFAGITGTTLGIWIFYFYTTVVGLSPIEAGSILAIARIWDGITDPTMGYITDNTRSRWGRRRVYFLIGIPLTLSFGLLWIDGYSYIYYLLTYLLFNTIFTIVQVPYETLASEMTSDFKMRCKLTGVRMIFAQSGALIASWLPAYILQQYDSEATAFMVVGGILAVLCTLPWIFVYKGTWERTNLPERNPAPFFQEMRKLFFEMGSTFRLKIFRVHLCMYVGAFVALDVFNASFVHYLTFVLDLDKGMIGYIITLLAIMQFAGTPIYAFLCMKIGNSKTYRIAVIIALLGVLLWALVSFFDVPVYFAFIAAFVLGLSRGGIYLVPWNIYNFIPDVDEALTKERREGIYAGVMTLTRKITQAFSIMLVGVVLEYSGFISGSEVQSASAISGLQFALLGGTALFLIFGFISSFRFGLDQKNHEVLVTEINRLKEGGNLAEADKSAKLVIEDLTGWSHDKTWGNNSVSHASRMRPS